MNNISPKDYSKEGKQALLFAKIVAGLTCLEAIWLIFSYGTNSKIWSDYEAFSSYLKNFVLVDGYLATGRFVGFILFCAWIDKLYKNMKNMGIYTNYHSRWVFLGWFVPIAHLFVPYRIVEEVYAGVQYMRNPDDEGGKKSSTIRWWWAFTAIPATTVWILLILVFLFSILRWSLDYLLVWIMLNFFLIVISSVLQIKVIQALARQEKETLRAFAEGTNIAEKHF